MGVINLTPDSFSDGGEINTVLDLKKKISYFKSMDIDIFDFGAQSTAPASQAISDDEELKRFDLFFECFLSLGLKEASVSIDTYRPVTFAKLYEFLKKQGHKGDVFWNDVSGVLDTETINLLKDCPDIKYVFTYTNIPKKESTPLHKNFIDHNVNKSSIIGKLKEGLIKLSFFTEKKIIFDLGFGFSKTQEQNYDLFKNIKNVLQAFDQKSSWLWGLSRKSFLHKLFDDDKDFFQSELMHILALNEIKKYSRNSIIRVHDPRITRVFKLFENKMNRS